MKTLVPTVAWRIDEADHAAVDARVLPLLAAIAADGSLAAAALRCELPYRTAWEVLAQAQASLGQPLVATARGRGATLTPFALRLRAAHADAEAVLAAATMPVPLREGRVAMRARTGLRVAGSHDLVLAQVRDAWRRRHGIALEFQGSAHALSMFAAGRADLAGFHVGVDGARAATGDPLLAWLDPARDVVIRFLVRTQGLILPRGNPDRVHGLRDVVAQRLPFVNRQAGSGTRVLLDRLLGDEALSARDLPGYTQEEFTHAAVAATVAAGNARAGLGIQAAAAQLGLAFVPLAQEAYGFACRRARLATPDVSGFRRLLASAATRRVITPMPGYHADRPGTLWQPART